MRIDLHTHSNRSDGTDDPATLVRVASEAGLDVVALTDHDTTAGWAEAEAALADLPTGLRLVRGAELSCVSPNGLGGTVAISSGSTLTASSRTAGPSIELQRNSGELRVWPT